MPDPGPNHIDRRVTLVDEFTNPINGANPLPVTSSGGGGGGVALQDKATFTEGTSNFTPVGGFVNETAAGDVAEDKGGAARITPKRAIHVNLRDDTGVEIGTASAPVRIDPTGTTVQPVSDGGGSLTVDGTVTVSSVGGTVTVDQVDTASLDYDTDAGTVNQTVMGIALPGSGGPVAGGTGTNPVRTDPTGTTTQPISDAGGSLTVDAPTATPVPIAITTTADALVKPGDAVNNAIRVNIVAGGASGGTSAVDESAFAEGTSLFTPVGGVFNDALSSDPAAGEQAAARITAKRGLHVNLRNDSGTEIGTAGSPIRTDPTGATAQPISDNGGSITVDGTVAATQSGAWNVGVTANVTPANRSTSGTIAGTGQDVQLAIPGAGTATLQLTGAWSGVIQMQASDNGGADWFVIYSINSDSNLTAQNVFSANGLFIVPCAGWELIRAVATSWTIGTALVELEMSTGTQAVRLLEAAVFSQGSLNGLGANLTFTVLNHSALAVQLTGVWSGTVSFEATSDGGTFEPVTAVDPVTGEVVTSVTTNGIWLVNCADFLSLRVIMTGYVSGSANLSVSGGIRSNLAILAAPLPNGANTIGAVNQAGSWSVAATQSGGWTVTVQDGGGSLTVDGTVAVTDGGGSLTVDGTVTANQGGSWTVAVSSIASTVTVDQADTASLDYDTGGGTVNQTVMGIALPGSGGPVAGGTATNPVRTDPTGTTAQPVTDNGGSLTVDDGGGTLTVDAPAASPVPIAITDTSDTIVKAGDSGNNAIRVNIVAGAGSGGTALADKGTFTEGTTSFTPVGGVFNETISADPTEDQAAAARITAKRAIHVNLRDDTGIEIGTASTPVRIDPTGSTTQPVSGTVAVSSVGGTVTVSGTVTIGTALPAGNNNIGDVDVASLPATTNAGATVKTLDYDTGGGTDTVTIFGIALPASGGAVAGGTATDPIRVDPTGVTTQPVSGTVTANQGGAWSVTIGAALPAGTNNIGDVDVASLPATTNAGATAKVLDYDTGAGTDNVTAFGILIPKSGGAVAGGTSADPVRVDPTGTTTQPVSDAGGSLTVDGTVAVSSVGGTVTVDQVDTASLDYDTGGGTVNQTVIGIALPGSGGPVAGGTATNPVRTDPTGTTTQPVSDAGGSLTVDGTVTVDQGTAAAGSGAWPITVTNTSDTVVKPGDAVNNAIRVNIVAGSSSGVSQVDRSAFTDGTSTFAPIGGYFDDAATNPTSGQAATARITAKRAVHTNLRDNSGNEIGIAASPLRIDPTGTTTQPVSGTVTLGAGSATVGSVKITDGTTVATVRDLAANDALNVAIVDGSGNQVTSFGGGTSTVASTNNSSTATLTANTSFTGAGESVLAYAAVTVNLRASHDGATDGISIEWSNDNSNWDRTEKWDYKADKPFSVCLRPKGEFFRVVYTNGGTNQTAFRLETILHGSVPRTESFIESGRIVVDGVSYKVKWVAINATASGDNTVISLVSGKKLRILNVHFSCSNTVDIAFKSGSNTLISAASFAKYGGLLDNPLPGSFFVETNAGEAFIINLSGAVNVRGRCTYIEI